MNVLETLAELVAENWAVAALGFVYPWVLVTELAEIVFV